MTVRILLIDDHAVVREAVVHLLSSDPALSVVACAADAASGLRLAQEHRPEIILLDLALPDADGLDLIEPLRRRCPDSCIVVLSMHDDPEYVAAAVRRGAHGLIAKSSSPKHFLSSIHRAACREPLHEDPMPWTEREQHVLALLAEGKSDVQIATALCIRPKTVDGYIQRLMERTQLHTRVGLVQYARRSQPARSHGD